MKSIRIKQSLLAVLFYCGVLGYGLVGSVLADDVTLNALVKAGLELSEAQQAEILAAEGDELDAVIEALYEEATPENQLLISKALSPSELCDRGNIVGRPYVCGRFAHLRRPPLGAFNENASPHR